MPNQWMHACHLNQLVNIFQTRCYDHHAKFISTRRLIHLQWPWQPAREELGFLHQDTIQIKWKYYLQVKPNNLWWYILLTIHTSHMGDEDYTCEPWHTMWGVTVPLTTIIKSQSLRGRKSLFLVHDRLPLFICDFQWIRILNLFFLISKLYYNLETTL